MDSLTDAEFKMAEARGQAMLEVEPRATAARYNRGTGRVTVDLVNGCTYVFPAHLVQDLESASHDDLANIEVDVSVSIFTFRNWTPTFMFPRWLPGVGTRNWMYKALARRAAAQSHPQKPLHPGQTAQRAGAEETGLTVRTKSGLMTHVLRGEPDPVEPDPGPADTLNDNHKASSHDLFGGLRALNAHRYPFRPQYTPHWISGSLTGPFGMVVCHAMSASSGS